MPFKIRAKLIIAFFAIIFPFIIAAGIIAFYNASNIKKANLKVNAIQEEMHLVMSLQLALDMALMPGNDYIITGNKKFADKFYNASKAAEDLIKKLEETLVVLKGIGTPEVIEEMDILISVKTAWSSVKEISQKIFAIPNPVGNKEAAMLMEEMDYKWAYPAIEKLDRWHEIDKMEMSEAVERVNSAWRMTWIIMFLGAFLLIASGVLFSYFYSGLFTKPIKIIHDRADEIAKGDFKARIVLKTGDELEQLSNAMSEMAAQLDSMYSNMQAMVDERTMELKESETRFRSIIETAKDAIVCIEEIGVIYQWNKSAEEMFGWTANEAVGRGIHSLIVPERFREKANEGFKTFFVSGTGTIVGKTIEIVGLKKDGTEFPVELSISAVNIKDKRHAVGIIRDITERKETEKKLAEQMDFLKRFHKAAVQREFRVKELRDENKILKARIEEMEKKK